MSSYKDQLLRVGRFLRRVENIARDQVEYEDDLWSFFQNCWHLKDWIKNDDALSQGCRDSVERDAEKFESLMICADLANRSKHLRLTKIRKDANLRVHIEVQIQENVRTAESSSSVSWQYAVVFENGSQREALDVARSAVKDWKMLLSGHSLS